MLKIEAMKVLCDKMRDIENLLLKQYVSYSGEDRKVLREEYVKLNAQLLKLSNEVSNDKK